MAFSSHSALMVIGVHWPPLLNDATRRAQVPLGHCITAEPHVPAPLYTKAQAELEVPAQLRVRQGDIWGCKRDAESRFEGPDFGGWPLQSSLMCLELLYELTLNSDLESVRFFLAI